MDNSTSQSHRHELAEQLRRFIAVVFLPDDVAELRMISAGQPPFSEWSRVADLPSMADKLQEWNREGFNIYIGVNSRCDYGERGNAAVTSCRCLAADFDNTTTAQANEAIRLAGLPAPTLLVWSGHGVHAYWLLIIPLSPELWRDWQRDLAATLGSDPAIHNPERIMRLPGFANLKREPTPSFIIDADASRVYDLADLADFIPMRDGSDTPPKPFIIRRVVSDADTGNPFNRARAYLAKLPAAVAFSKGHKTCWHAVNTIHRFGVSKEDATELLREYSSRCDPPWSEREIEHKVAQAFAKNPGEHGLMLRRERTSTSTFRIIRKGVA